MTEKVRDDKPFLSRWSERKREAQTEEASAQQEADERASTPAPEKQELDANRAAAEAIDVETLTNTSDYTPFFRPGVPVALKNTALRKLWRSHPVFYVNDGLTDYNADYRFPAKADVVKTAWKIGRGFLTDDDQTATRQRAAEKPAGDPTAVRPVADAGEEPRKDAEEELAAPAGRAPEGEPQPAADHEAEPEEAERSKVTLARRLDFAAFSKEKSGG